VANNGYNRYLDSLPLKASEIFTLQTEATFKLKEGIDKKSIVKGLDNETISHITGLSTDRIEKLRKGLKNKSKNHCFIIWVQITSVTLFQLLSQFPRADFCSSVFIFLW